VPSGPFLLDVEDQFASLRRENRANDLVSFLVFFDDVSSANFAICKFCSLMMGARLIAARFWEEIINGLLIGFRSNCQMFATLRSNFSCVTIAPHENPN
jgi:hypothetical protein